jgi:hypothetical protein
LRRFPKGNVIFFNNIVTELTFYPLAILRYLLHVFPLKTPDVTGSTRKGKRDSPRGFDDETRIPASEYVCWSVIALVLITFPTIPAATYLSGKLERPTAIAL